MTRRCSRPTVLPTPGVPRRGRTCARDGDKVDDEAGQIRDNSADRATAMIAQNRLTKRKSAPDRSQSTIGHDWPGLSDQPPQPQSP